jgi:hypothetical protein
MWYGVMRWHGVAWRGVAWRGVAWRGVAWRGVAWTMTYCEPYNILNISDIDECSEVNVSCHPNATCINTQGSYNCQCKDGYEGFGKKNCTGKTVFVKQNTFFLHSVISDKK